MRSPLASLFLIVALAGCSSDVTPEVDGSTPRDDAGTAGDAGTVGTDGGTAVDGGGASDPLAEARRICLDEINRLRATRGLPPYAPWTEAQTCVDGQATSDEASGTPHGAWSAGSECNGNGQNECLGGGAAGIVGCLGRMWAEREQPGCAGCDACADAYDPSCPNCDFFGSTTGDVCGHYVNMSARYFTEVACGFSSGGGWAAQNFR